jgi:hypothetical protein
VEADDEVNDDDGRGGAIYSPARRAFAVPPHPDMQHVIMKLARRGGVEPGRKTAGDGKQAGTVVAVTCTWSRHCSRAYLQRLFL